ncbi:hypothetical protein IQ268_30530 [Oculatella sp. LEGE 06141]|uniref:hypothetical protein n=1 Tax=Oculatella sp. LEGE 06141 TaxID=1828648 RepID=UPI00187F3DF5|nr:hypothetical protein [Oculatella sp. LEGE 06141]MBE9182875.1 hypothetical protein [Oculatella sp. LEGE 06141]
MPWQSLGTISPSEDWQSYPIDPVGSETFRIVQSLSIEPFNICLLTQYFAPPGGRATFRRVYPSNEPTIITLPIPEDLRASGIVVRTLQIKRRLPYFPAPWQIEIQVFY